MINQACFSGPSQLKDYLGLWSLDKQSWQHSEADEEGVGHPHCNQEFLWVGQETAIIPAPYLAKPLAEPQQGQHLYHRCAPSPLAQWTSKTHSQVNTRMVWLKQFQRVHNRAQWSRNIITSLKWVTQSL